MSEPGTTVEFKPHPTIEDKELDEMKYYRSSLSHFRMIRKDGKSIVFSQHFFESDASGDVEYLDSEIKARNPYIRYATPEEVRDAHYRRDPKAFLTTEIKSDAGFMEQLKADIRRQLEDEMKMKGVDPSVNNTQEIDRGVILERLKPVSTADIASGAAT